jgi:hypothetical protein
VAPTEGWQPVLQAAGCRFMESHGQLVHVSPTEDFRFHLVFSNKTESDTYCISIWQSLTARHVAVWQGCSTEIC